MFFLSASIVPRVGMYIHVYVLLANIKLMYIAKEYTCSQIEHSTNNTNTNSVINVCSINTFSKYILFTISIE